MESLVMDNAGDTYLTDLNVKAHKARLLQWKVQDLLHIALELRLRQVIVKKGG